MSIPLRIALTGGLVLAGSAVVLASAGSSRSSATLATAAGHLVLVVEGDARRLEVTHIVAKTEPYGRDRTVAPHQVVVLAADRSELGRFALDLSGFDLDPARVGAPARVEGDQVFPTSVVALVNIPRFVHAASLRIERDGAVVGELSAERYARLLAEGRPR